MDLEPTHLANLLLLPHVANPPKMSVPHHFETTAFKPPRYKEQWRANK